MGYKWRHLVNTAIQAFSLISGMLSNREDLPGSGLDDKTSPKPLGYYLVNRMVQHLRKCENSRPSGYSFNITYIINCLYRKWAIGNIASQ